MNSANPIRPESNPFPARAGVVLLLIVFLLSPAFSRRLTPLNYAGGRTRDQHEIEERNTSAIAAILGEVRASMSDLMFIKTERYLDNGIAYMPHIDMDRLSSSGEVHQKPGEAAKTAPETAKPKRAHAAASAADSHTTDAAVPAHAFEFEHDLAHEHEHEGAQEGENTQGQEKAHEHEHANVPTIIRTADKDFRGFIGNLERKVQPWNDPSQPHQHTTGTELLPWYRLQTLSDPHNIRAYLIGSWWLKTMGPAQKEEALRFAGEGIQNNPKAFQLYLMKGDILRALGREAESLPFFKRGADLATEQRPKGAPDNPDAPWWNKYTDQDARTVARFAVLLEKQYGNRAEALKMARRYLKAFEDEDGILERQIRVLEGREADPAEKGKEKMK